MQTLKKKLMEWCDTRPWSVGLRSTFLLGFVITVDHIPQAAPTQAATAAVPQQAKVPTSMRSHQVDIGETGYLRRADGDGVLVFKSRDALSKAQSLVKAGAETRLVYQYIPCVPPVDAKVLVITGEISSAFASGMDGTSDVTIITGSNAGCVKAQ